MNKHEKEFLTEILAALALPYVLGEVVRRGR